MCVSYNLGIVGARVCSILVLSSCQNGNGGWNKQLCTFQVKARSELCLLIKSTQLRQLTDETDCEILWSDYLTALPFIL